MRQLKINKSITPRSEQSLDKYLSEISRVPMVSTEEEVLLAQAIHAGGKKGDQDSCMAPSINQNQLFVRGIMA